MTALTSPQPPQRSHGAAARMARYRARLRRGVVVAPVPVGRSIIEMLLDLGLLDDAVSEDRQAVGDAIAAVLADAAADLRRKGDASTQFARRWR